MTPTSIEMTEDDFDARYPLRPNHLNPNAGWSDGGDRGCLFETHGAELAFVRHQPPGTIWTLVDGDHGDLFLISGCHVVNRVGYLIGTAAVPDGTEVRVRIEVPDENAIPDGKEV